MSVSGFKQFRYLKELKVRIGCKMDLSRFPHDTQTCFFKIGSFGHTDEFVEITFTEELENTEIEVPHPNGYTIAIHFCQIILIWKGLF